MPARAKKVKESQKKGHQAAVEARKTKKRTVEGINPCTKLPHTPNYRPPRG